MEYEQMELPFGEDELPPLHDPVSLASDFGLVGMAAMMHETAKKKGFWPPKYYDAYSDTVSEEAICTKLALVHSEVTEVLEAIRKEQGQEKVVEEMADVIVRLLDLYAALLSTGQVDADLDDVVQLKMKKNTLRPKLHGNRF